MNQLDLIPLFSRLVVKRKEIDKIGSIYIPDNSLEMKATEGIVLVVGNECDTVKPGDTVFFGKYSGAEIERDGVKYIIMNEEDVLCFVKQPENKQ